MTDIALCLFLSLSVIGYEAINVCACVCVYVHSVFKANPVKQTEPGHRRIVCERETEKEPWGERKGNIMREGRKKITEKKKGRMDKEKKGWGNKVSRV